MESEADNTELECYQTDVESLAGTSLNNSSVTQFPQSSETEYGEEGGIDDEVLEDLFGSQFPSSGVAHAQEDATKDVQEWLNKTNDGTEDTDAPHSQQPTEHTHREEIQKMAVALLHAIKVGDFVPDAWLEADDVQEVPSDDFICNFIKDAQDRLPLALMNIIKIIFGTTMQQSGFRFMYTEVLYCAAQEISGVGSCPLIKNFLDNATLEGLHRFRNGEYFSELRLSFKRLPKHKLPIVRAVQSFVTESISAAYKSDNAVLFNGYALIPSIVRQCNEDKGLGYNPDQVARYGVRLQEAVYTEMTARCLDFLAFSGFKLKTEYLENEETVAYLSSNDSALCQPLSQQSSLTSEDSESIICSQGSTNQEEGGSGNETGNQSVTLSVRNVNEPQDNANEAIRAMDESPGFREFLRNNADADNYYDSPGGSMNSNISSSPQYSMPELEPPEVYLPGIRRGEVRWNNVHLNEHSTIMVNLEEASASSGSHDNIDDSHDEPQRRRRRMQ